MTAHQDPNQGFRISVPAAFEAVFTHLYFAQNQSGQTITKTLLPSYQTVLIFSFGAKVLLHSMQKTEIAVDRCMVLGPIKQAFDYSLPDGAAILVANFKEDAFYRFFGTAAIAGQLPMHPDKLLEDNCFTLLWHQLNATESIDQRVNLIFEFSRPYLKERTKIAAQLAGFHNEATSSIKTIAEENRQSERNIQLQHKKYLGYSAKELNRYQRFLKALERIQEIAEKAGKMDWFEVIHACGYYDQSQLIHDFKHYLNLSPTQYLKFQQNICQAKG